MLQQDPNDGQAMISAFWVVPQVDRFLLQSGHLCIRRTDCTGNILAHQPRFFSNLVFTSRMLEIREISTGNKPFDHSETRSETRSLAASKTL